MNLLVLAPVFVVIGVWGATAGVVARYSPRPPSLPPTRHERRVRQVTLIDA